MHTCVFVAFAAATLLLGITFSGSASASDSASMDARVRVRPSLTLDISSSGTAVSDITLNLDPASNPYDSKDLNIKVGTNNATGYVLNLSTADNTTDLTNIGDNSIKIPTLSSTAGATPSSLTANTWGMKKGTGSYEPFAAGTILQNNNRTNEDAITLSFAAKIDYLKQSGKYEQDLVFTITPNVVSYTMQDLDAAVCTKDPIEAIDLRDNQTYWVAELDDGNCWMLQDLQLGKNLAVTSGSITLTPANSNVSENWALTGKVVSPGQMPSNTITDDVTGGDGIVEKTGQEKAFYCTPDSTNLYHSCYYNWYTATTGKGTKYVTGKDVTDGVDVNESICPKGWVLPKGGPSGDFRNLITFYPTSAQALVDPMSAKDNTNGASQPGFLIGGHYIAIGEDHVGVNGYYWSRTAFSTGRAYYLYLDASTVSPSSYGNKFNGFPVRCIRETRTLLDIENMQDISPAIVANTNEGTFKALKDTRDNQTYMVGKIKDGQIWMLQNLQLGGATGRGSGVSESLTLTPANSDVATTTTITYTTTPNFPRNSSSDRTWDGWAFYCSPDGDNPYESCYYNWYTATAGTGKKDTPAAGVDATSSICPKGWRLPRRGSDGDFNMLYEVYYSSAIADMLVDNPSTTYDNADGKYRPGFLLSSSAYDNIGPSYVGTYGSYWTNTVESTEVGYAAFLNASDVWPNGHAYKYYGISIRCIAR